MKASVAVAFLLLTSNAALAHHISCDDFKIGFTQAARRAAVQTARFDYRPSPYFDRTYEVQNLVNMSAGFDCDENGRFLNFGTSMAAYSAADLQRWHDLAQAALAVIAPAMSASDRRAYLESLSDQAFKRAQREMLGSGQATGRADQALLEGYVVTYELTSHAVRMTITGRRRK